MKDETQKNERLARFGARVRDLRKGNGLSQESLGACCDLDQTYISGIETGQRNVSFLNIAALADALKVSLSELMEGV